MKILNLQGLIAAPFTPMNGDGALNPGLIPKYYEVLKSNGVNGAFICGSTGEGVSLTLKEKKIVAEAWVDSLSDDRDFKLISLVGGTCIQDCIDLARHSQEIGVDAVAITAPFYFKPSSIDLLAEVCLTVGRSVPGLPLYYYHIPVLTGVGFQMIDLLRMLDGKMDNFAGIKYTHEDFMDFLSCINFKEGKYDMLWGRDESFLSALVLGAKGAVGSTFNYAAPLYHQITEAFNNGDLESARQGQQKAIDMIRLLGKYGGIATGKAFMKLIDVDCGEFRLPVKNMTAVEFESFKRDVEKLNFADFCSKMPITYRPSL